jgi:hypothetical protein
MRFNLIRALVSRTTSGYPTAISQRRHQTTCSFPPCSMQDLIPHTRTYGFSFASPCVSVYEKQKGFQIIRGSENSRGVPTRLPPFAIRQGMHESGLQELFVQRISHALSGDTNGASPFFPGNYVVGTGNKNCRQEIVDRGILYFNQFKYLLNKTGRSGASLSATTYLQPVANSDTWLWKNIERPNLQFIQLESGETEHRQFVPQQLWQECLSLLQTRRTLDLLKLIRHTWAPTSQNADYSPKAVAQCEAWLAKLSPSADCNSLLSALFEIEAYASIASTVQDLELIGSGLFADNWIEVGFLSLERFRPTELCETQRLLEELVNLTNRGFAPIVVNEKLCVADGNHRLTAAWIWNLLCATSTLDWNINSHAFQQAVADFVHGAEIHPVTIHECLSHLSSWLCHPTSKRILTDQVRPRVSTSFKLNKLPATVLPEHLSGAVVKGPYDQGLSVQRAEPLLYDIMALTPNTVLPPRVSYHFTDRALLPWFQLIPPKPLGNRSKAKHHHKVTPMLWPPGSRLR